MKFTLAVLAAASGAAATYGGYGNGGGYGGGYGGSNVTVTTEIVNSYTTYCPYATQITHGSQTYTVTEATTLTITNCPCTITRPVYSTSSVECTTSAVAPPPPPPTTTAVYVNSTLATVPATIPATAPATGYTSVPTAGAGKAAALSGAGLAGLVGLAAFVL